MEVAPDVPVRRRRVTKEAEKCALVARHLESGKSMASFCRDEGITVRSFVNWRKKFAAKPAFVEVPVPMPSVAVEVVLISGDRVSTSSDCDPLWLAKLIRSIGTPSC